MSLNYSFLHCCSCVTRVSYMSMDQAQTLGAESWVPRGAEQSWSGVGSFLK